MNTICTMVYNLVWSRGYGGLTILPVICVSVICDVPIESKSRVATLICY
jgi:hypothetical protein